MIASPHLFLFVNSSLPPHLSRCYDRSSYSISLSSSNNIFSLLISPDLLTHSVPAAILRLCHRCNFISAIVVPPSLPWSLLLRLCVAAVAPFECSCCCSVLIA
ncbi:hypothetical protein CICLE_v10024628mg [Citrus x clementina]|uniref:Uncharacterized protein n=1 Tax=Citrus clementina TaxID=85681 RepID=V4U6M4_CITCL|nr:hypothetical protein CICLE_v10024628mg [Citrus x clementina]